MRNLEDFEQTHGQTKIKELQRRLEIEQKKVESLADVQNKIHIRDLPENKIRFAIVGDIHAGSLHFDQGALEGFANYCADIGITDVYAAGDIIDGHKIYRGQEFELRDLGLDKQLERVQGLDLPHELTWHFITGNHDDSFKNESGVHVGKAIERVRPDFYCLGETQATVKFQTDVGSYKLMLLHPGGGSSYALSYRPQKIVESIEGGQKPNMLAIGHYHKAEMIPSYRNVTTIQTGTFQRQTPFMQRGGLAAHVGGWIVEVTMEEKANRVQCEFISFF